MTVLYEWKFAGYVCRIVESEPGIVHFEQAQALITPLKPGHHLAFNPTDKPLGCANEIIHLSQALAEANVINRDLSKAIQGFQEERNRREAGAEGGRCPHCNEAYGEEITRLRSFEPRWVKVDSDDEAALENRGWLSTIYETTNGVGYWLMVTPIPLPRDAAE